MFPNPSNVNLIKASVLDFCLVFLFLSRCWSNLSFIEKFGTHIIVGGKMGGKDVIYMKQHHASSLKPVDVVNKLKAMADVRFLDSDGHFATQHVSQNTKDLVSIFQRRGRSDDKNLTHSERLHTVVTVQSEPDIITMSFIPLTSLLDGVPENGYLSHAINLYLRCEQHLSVSIFILTNVRHKVKINKDRCEKMTYIPFRLENVDRVDFS